jgi:hypothetical protein
MIIQVPDGIWMVGKGGNKELLTMYVGKFFPVEG